MKTKLIISLSILLLVFVAAYRNRVEESTVIPVDNTNNNSTGLNLTHAELKERLEYLLTGQIYKYESERDFKEIQTGSVIEDNTEFGKGAKVIYCKSGRDKEGYAVKGLVKNSRVCDMRDKWQNDTNHDWQIRPRIRIKQSLIYPMVQGYNEENWHTKICRLEIINTQGKIIKEIEYEGKDFWEKHPEDECRIYYSGNYRDRKSFFNTFDSVIIISGRELNPKGECNIKDSKLDYRIYWYGYTDLWIDYIKVENETAVELLYGGYDMWLKTIAENPDALIYKMNFNSNINYICLEYINKKIKEYTRQKFAAVYSSDNIK